MPARPPCLQRDVQRVCELEAGGLVAGRNHSLGEVNCTRTTQRMMLGHRRIIRTCSHKHSPVLYYHNVLRLLAWQTAVHCSAFRMFYGLPCWTRCCVKLFTPGYSIYLPAPLPACL